MKSLTGQGRPSNQIARSASASLAQARTASPAPLLPSWRLSAHPRSSTALVRPPVSVRRRSIAICTSLLAGRSRRRRLLLSREHLLR